jgi:hypothetical protein
MEGAQTIIHPKLDHTYAMSGISRKGDGSISTNRRGECGDMYHPWVGWDVGSSGSPGHSPQSNGNLRAEFIIYVAYKKACTNRNRR